MINESNISSNHNYPVKVQVLFCHALGMSGNKSNERITYGNYLQLENLLSLQEGPSNYFPAPCNDEKHFIIVHQAFELWFKLILSELKCAHKMLNNDNIDEDKMPLSLIHI